MAPSPPLGDRILTADQQRWPRLHDAGRATRLGAILDDAGIALPAKLSDFLGRVASGAPYLDRLMRLDPHGLERLLATDPDQYIEARLKETEAVQGPDAPARLRGLKKQVALALSLLDLSGLWDDRAVMKALSAFADAAVRAAFEHALREAAGPLVVVPDFDRLLPRSGLVIYAMGKHGACELNYSSDIDLVIFHDPQRVDALTGALELPARMRETKRFLTRVVQLAVSALHDQTAEGYVFRTDLRLRPDPGSSSPTVSIGAAEYYYETYGQNWERAAFIKARAIAGDKAVEREMNGILEPFVWRKYLDFTAIEDIHSIKRQIHAVRGQANIEFEGHDIKLGRGGIREIEFFVQAQQLILGGRVPSLREPTTIGGLQALAAAGHITGQASKELQQCYLALRHWEHRIQMVNDEQTHLIPASKDELERLAHLCGHDEVAALRDAVLDVLRRVHDHYADLFHESEDLSAGVGSLVFTGVDHDPETLRTLAELGFANPEAASAIVRKWHAGNMRATRSARGRALLTRLVPVIIRACAGVDDPDAALAAFDAFLRNMPSGVQMFSLMLNNPEVIEIIAGLVNLSPRLAREMAVHARLVEVLLDVAFLHQGEADIEIDTQAILDAVAEAEDFEAALNVLRREDREVWFQICCRLLLSRSGIRDASRSYTELADTGVEASLNIAEREMVTRHGSMDGGIAVIGMGRLGAAGLTATSDLDLIFIYDAPEDARAEGSGTLDSTTWYTRYVRRAVTALSAQTEEGGLYDIDMALRPSGGAGPAAVSFRAFETYYRKDAWVWEEMALVKARVVAGNDALADRLDREIEKVLTRPRDREATARDVIDMRCRLLSAKPARSVLDVKRAHGGLTDIDFLCQYLSLVHGHEKGRFPPHIADALPVMADLDLITRTDADTLLAAALGYEEVIQVARIAIDRDADPAVMPASVRRLLAERLELPDSDAIEPWLDRCQQGVQALFEKYVGPLVPSATDQSR